MGVDFRGVQVLVPQDLLHRLHVHAVLQHQRGGGMAQLVAGILLAVQSGGGQVLFHQCVHHGAADALVLTGEEQRVPVPAGDGSPHRQIPCQRVLARLVQIHHAHLAALAENTQGVVVDVADIQPNQLGNTQSAVQKQRQDAVIPLPVGTVHRVQKGEGLVQRQVAGKGLHLLGRVHVLAGIFLQKMPFVANIIEK